MINLIPKPKQIKELPGSIILNETIGLNNEGFDSFVLNAFISRFNLKIEKGDFLNLKIDETLGKEGYKLIVNDNITIYANTNNGVIYALSTLSQLIQNNSNIPKVEINDYPSLSYRGAHLDSSRHFFGINEVLKIIEELSLVKINYFHWHLSDDQGFRIESLKFPKLQEQSKLFFSRKDIQNAVVFAKERGIEIIPEIDIPGHTSAILSAYKELGCLGKEIPIRQKYGIFKEILCPSKIASIDFIKELLKEIIELFPCKYIHIGGDEAPKSEWKICPDCNNKMKELGYSSFNDLQSHFTNEIASFLKTLGKETIVWSDTLKSNKINNDIIIQYWEPTRSLDTYDFLNKGGLVIYSDMFEYYFDYPHSMSNLKKVFTTLPHLKNNIVYDKLYGIEACLWTERVLTETNLEEKMFPRIFAVAERAWGSNATYSDFEQRLLHLVDNNVFKIDYTNPNWWNPKGIKRFKQTLSYCKEAAQGSNISDAEPSNISFDSIKNFIKKFIL